MRLIVLVALSACVPTSYTWSPTVNVVTARQPNCQFAILAALPEEQFEEIGTMKHYNGDVPKTEAEFRKAISSNVCEVGGHAVITTKGYEAATVIKYPRGFHQ
jgi:hypothetical protein